MESNTDSRSSERDGSSDSPAACDLRRDAALDDVEPAEHVRKADFSDVRLAENTDHDLLKTNAKSTIPPASQGLPAKDGPRKTRQDDLEPLAGSAAALRSPSDSHTARATGDQHGTVDRVPRAAIATNHGFLS
eukprot:CAMPEP_0202084350 /NCGR_PEP_ID=MMETSP0964-20121228/27417_1 /ASSEMBLY_ACC=CAM_ASM_000500 /TAXON_ID=4773 /ORGANISM="Schizochytrium aggregatum, Strain ATCC28209" /LENGTH=132 /DNA_ID=CAMNT_0048652117 /DNA_START=81 /DNA_END=475 /DNA_ORIENTATION=-